MYASNVKSSVFKVKKVSADSVYCVTGYTICSLVQAPPHFGRIHHLYFISDFVDQNSHERYVSLWVCLCHILMLQHVCPWQHVRASCVTKHELRWSLDSKHFHLLSDVTAKSYCQSCVEITCLVQPWTGAFVQRDVQGQKWTDRSTSFGEKINQDAESRWESSCKRKHALTFVLKVRG
jgi:hypothetical protein